MTNALDAFDRASHNKSYAEIEACPNQIIIQTTLEGEYIKIHIQDNGCGIDPEVKKRIFERGFTTKAVGKGTGLGMAIARQIVTEKHGGAIVCDSILDQETTFAIALPIEQNLAVA